MTHRALYDHAPEMTLLIGGVIALALLILAGVGIGHIIQWLKFHQ